ncbi:MAG: helix-turn-helix domain-containing protein [Christensenellaceae bacterium]|jgi:repressor LexA|nr:helix-turn-helix domain-containing protein [Christensenellaceae bacterium]
MEKFNTILKRLRIERGLSRTEVGNVLGVTDQAIWSYENGTREPSRERIQRFADFYNVSMDYLTGRTLSRNSADVGDEEKVVPSANEGMYQIPILGTVHAGAPVFADQNYDGYIYSNYHPSEHFAIRVKGDCLKDLGINDSTIITVRKQEYAQNGDIVICLYEGEIIIRQYLHHSSHLHFLVTKNHNKIYDPIIWNATADLRMIGKGVEFKTRLY